MIEFRNVGFRYESNAAVLSHFSWRVPRGELWTVLGKSGCGKSTLLMLIAGLLTPQEGGIVVGGEPVKAPTPRNGLVLQDYELLPWATIRRNVELGLRVRKAVDAKRGEDAACLSREERICRVDRWINRLGISGVADRYPHQVSGGQRQRAAIARALAMDVERLLMDEPFSALDAPTRENLQELTLGLCRENGLTLVLVTHFMDEAAFMGQRVLVMGGGHPARVRTIENTHGTEPEYRLSREYRARCAELREALG